MLHAGVETNGEWNQYTAQWDLAPGCKSSWYNHIEPKIPSIDKIKSIGVDWKKTFPPSSSVESEFMDTESPSKNVEALLGELILLDDTRIKIGVSGNGMIFSEYAKIIAEFAKDETLVEEIFGKE